MLVINFLLSIFNFLLVAFILVLVGFYLGLLPELRQPIAKLQCYLDNLIAEKQKELEELQKLGKAKIKTEKNM